MTLLMNATNLFGPVTLILLAILGAAIGAIMVGIGSTATHSRTKASLLAVGTFFSLVSTVSLWTAQQALLQEWNSKLLVEVHSLPDFNRALIIENFSRVALSNVVVNVTQYQLSIEPGKPREILKFARFPWEYPLPPDPSLETTTLPSGAQMLKHYAFITHSQGFRIAPSTVHTIELSQEEPFKSGLSFGEAEEPSAKLFTVYVFRVYFRNSVTNEPHVSFAVTFARFPRIADTDRNEIVWTDYAREPFENLQAELTKHQMFLFGDSPETLLSR